MADLAPCIKMTFSSTMPHNHTGDYDETGWYSHRWGKCIADDDTTIDSVDVLPDEWDREDGRTIIDKAVDFLNNKGMTEASSSHFHPGAWYSGKAGDSRERIRTGEHLELSCHLYGLTTVEAFFVWCKFHEVDIFTEYARNPFLKEQS